MAGVEREAIFKLAGDLLKNNEKYNNMARAVCPGVLLSDRDRVVVAVSGDVLPGLIAQAAMVCEHRFDLLGSGVVPVDYQVRTAGVEGYCYDLCPGAGAAAAFNGG